MTNPDTIIELMEKACFKVDAYDSRSAFFWYPELKMFAKLLEQHVAEECAKQLDSTGNDHCAEAIRSMYK